METKRYKTDTKTEKQSQIQISKFGFSTFTHTKKDSQKIQRVLTRKKNMAQCSYRKKIKKNWKQLLERN